MYDMTSTPAYGGNQETIIALGQSGNKLVILEQNWRPELRHQGVENHVCA